MSYTSLPSAGNIGGKYTRYTGISDQVPAGTGGVWYTIVYFPQVDNMATLQEALTLEMNPSQVPPESSAMKVEIAIVYFIYLKVYICILLI